MSQDELTSEDFAKYDLPDRPLRFCPEYQRNVRHFWMICFAVGVLLVGISIFALL